METIRAETRQKILDFLKERNCYVPTTTIADQIEGVRRILVFKELKRMYKDDLISVKEHARINKPEIREIKAYILLSKEPVIYRKITKGYYWRIKIDNGEG